MEEIAPHVLSRMDWGFGNPNKTATLIALMMLGVWGLGYFRKWGFWVALVVSGALGVELMMTQSRGGVVGFIMGALILLVWIRRPFSLSKLTMLVVVCLGLVAFAYAINVQSRYAKGLSGTDLSIQNRLLIWKQVPSMIHDAPNGWGWGRSGDAYMQWYQPINRGEGYRTLVNSHLTWLVELGWWGRIAYVTLWMSIFVLVWPPSTLRWFSVPLALWVTLAVCSAFSSVAEAPFLWVIPLTALILVVMTRWNERKWPQLRYFLGAPTVTLLVLFGAYFVGIGKTSSPQVHCPRQGIVMLGSRSPQIWVVAPDREVLGEHFGHQIREAINSDPRFFGNGVGIAAQVKDVPTGIFAVFSGRIPVASDLSTFSRIIFIDPRPPNDNISPNPVAYPKSTVIVGEYSQNRAYWSEQSRLHLGIRLQFDLGCEDYLPDWTTQSKTALSAKPAQL